MLEINESTDRPWGEKLVPKRKLIRNANRLSIRPEL
jgi:hypothetical protein